MVDGLPFSIPSAEGREGSSRDNDSTMQRKSSRVDELLSSFVYLPTVRNTAKNAVKRRDFSIDGLSFGSGLLFLQQSTAG